MDMLFGWVNDLMGGMIVGFANFAADVVKNTFNMDSTNLDGSVATADLQVGTDVGQLVLVLAIPITVAAIITQVIRSAAGSRANGILRAVTGGVAMVVFSRIAFWYGTYAIQGFDELTRQLIDFFNQSPGGITDSIMQSLNFTYNASNSQWETTGGGAWNAPAWMMGGMAGTVLPIVPLIAIGCLALGGFLLMLMLGFRRWALVVMIGLAPLAFMFLPAEKAGKAVPLKWLHIAVSLLAAKPLSAIIVAITAKMMAASGQMNFLMFSVAVVSFLVAAVAPLIALKFFGFLGVEIGHAYAQAAGEGAMRQGAQNAQQAASAAKQLIPQKSSSGGGGSSDPVQPIKNTKPAATAQTPKAIGSSAGGSAAAGPAAAAVAGVQAVKAGVGKAKEAVGAAADAAGNGATPGMARHRPEEGAKTV